MVRVAQAYTVPQNGLYHLVDGIILSNHLVLQVVFQIFQTFAFTLCHALGRYAGHHADNVGNVFGCHLNIFANLSLLPLRLHVLNLFLDLGLGISA